MTTRAIVEVICHDTSKQGVLLGLAQQIYDLGLWHQLTKSLVMYDDTLQSVKPHSLAILGHSPGQAIDTRGLWVTASQLIDSRQLA
jgi:hypothetical protein